MVYQHDLRVATLVNLIPALDEWSREGWEVVCIVPCRIQSSEIIGAEKVPAFSCLVRRPVTAEAEASPATASALAQ